MTKAADSKPASSTTAEGVTKKVLTGDGAPADSDVMAANGAFPRDALASDKDDVELRTRVFAHVRKYSKASWGRAAWEVFHTLAFYFLVFQHTDSKIAFVLATLLRVRLFILFHDCAHEAFFPTKTANFVGGILLGSFNHTPLSFWKRGHNHHHRHRSVLGLRFRQ